ncbi:Cytochrome P450 [Penicillium malachiteum]|uniref:Cytochrome P450 n=1 Tax=Penicillium malachiteum TaxID=1324776 RepID=UPI0025489015|nr:Cytochrome P450 [Penicillium malachiteum]KAJ5713410.1 Cytochrome P450 [Penicillium malachiteum]
MLTPIHFAALTWAFVLISRRLWNLARQPKPAQSGQPVYSDDKPVSDPYLCHQLIQGKLTQGSKRNRVSFLSSKAMPNKGLQTVFGIKNAFTSDDAPLVKEFIDDARRRIKLKPEEWSGLTPMLVDVARNCIIVGYNTDGMENRLRGSALSYQPGIPSSTRFNITSLVQVVTLRAILATVLKVEAKDCPSNLDILNLARQINEGWIQSKNGNRPGRDDSVMLNFEQNKAIQASLQAVFPNQAEHGLNPLNILLPSFETMWRVVLRALLELKFQTGCENPEWAKAMVSFCWNVTKEEFERRPSLRMTTSTKVVIGGDSRPSQEKTPSAKDIVLESLRMYPPTRRIYRAYVWDDYPASCEPEPIYKAADIEACHLRTNIWGSNAVNFDPARWMTITRADRAQTHAFMPFGYGVCECPAKAVFGPRMIGVLVGALLSALDDEEGQWTLCCADNHVMSCLATKGRLSLERDAFNKLEVMRSESGE